MPAAPVDGGSDTVAWREAVRKGESLARQRFIAALRPPAADIFVDFPGAAGLPFGAPGARLAMGEPPGGRVRAHGQ